MLDEGQGQDNGDAGAGVDALATGINVLKIT